MVETVVVCNIRRWFLMSFINSMLVLHEIINNLIFNVILIQSQNITTHVPHVKYYTIIISNLSVFCTQ